MSRAHVWQALWPGGIWFLLHRSGPLHLWSRGRQVWTSRFLHYSHLTKSSFDPMLDPNISSSPCRVWPLSREHTLRTDPLLGQALVSWMSLKVPILNSALTTFPTLWSMTSSSDMNHRWLPLQLHCLILVLTFDYWRCLTKVSWDMFHQTSLELKGKLTSSADITSLHHVFALSWSVAARAVGRSVDDCHQASCHYRRQPLCQHNARWWQPNGVSASWIQVCCCVRKFSTPMQSSRLHELLAFDHENTQH